MTKRKTQPTSRLHHKLKLQAHHHSWRKLPHGQTSYPGLLVLLSMLGIFLALNTWSAKAATVTSSGNIQVSAIVPGPPPANAPVIQAPTTGQTLVTAPITVSGTCEPNLIVKLFRNGLFSGSAACSVSGIFSLQTDLTIGNNQLIARNYDGLDQPSPDSNTVDVIYDPPAPPSPVPSPVPATPSPNSSNTTTEQPAVELATPVPPVVVADQVVVVPVQGEKALDNLKPGSKFSWDVNISGGKPPYSLSVDWGDGTRMVKTVEKPAIIRLEHTYPRPGTFTIEVRSSDAAGRTSFFQIAAVVDGVVNTALGRVDSGTAEGQTLVRILALMPYYWAATGLVAAFWLGSHASTTGSIFGLRWFRAIRKP